MDRVIIKMSEFSRMSDGEKAKIRQTCEEKINAPVNGEISHLEFRIKELEIKIGKKSDEIVSLLKGGNYQETLDICDLLRLLSEKEHYSNHGAEK